MEERGVIKSSIQNKMEYSNKKLWGWYIVLLKNEAEHNQGLMGNIVAIKRDGKGDVWSVKLLVGASNNSFPKIFTPTKFESKIVLFPLLLPPTEISKFGSPFLLLLYWLYSSFPQLKIFNLCILILCNFLNLCMSTCVISCNTHDGKQVHRSKLIFEIHKQTHLVQNHIPNFRK